MHNTKAKPNSTYKLSHMFTKSKTFSPYYKNLISQLKTSRAGPLMEKLKTRASIFKFSSGRGGNQLDNFLEQLISKLPQGNVAFLFLGLNVLFYSWYLLCPKNQMWRWMNNCTVNSYNLQQGRLHTLITSHFSHDSFISFILDSAIIFLFCRNLDMMFGPLYTLKVSLLGILIGSALLMFQHSSSPTQRPFKGNDSILRALIFTVIFQNPTQSFYLLPFPFQIPAWAIAAVLLGMDFLTMNTAGFGGVSAAYLMLNYIR